MGLKKKQILDTPCPTDTLQGALWWYRGLKKTALAMAEEARLTKAEDIVYTEFGSHVLQSGFTNPHPFLLHAERCQRMIDCLETRGLVCFEKGHQL